MYLIRVSRRRPLRVRTYICVLVCLGYKCDSGGQVLL